LLCLKCKYPETTLYVKLKQLQSKCRACGNINILDSTHRAGIHISKNLPKNMSEIDEVKHEALTTSAPQTKEEEDKEEAKKKKKKEVLQPLEEEPLALNSEEICKCPPPISGLTDE
jgi:hypothetical protein